MRKGITLFNLSFVLLLVACNSSDGPAEKLYFVQLDEFGNSQELSISNDQYISDVESILEQADWEGVDKVHKTTLYSFYFKRNGSYGPSHIVWRDPEDHKIKLYSEKKRAFTVLNAEENKTLQKLKRIGEDNYLAEQLDE
ncbi:hypothetical protein [Pontibacillus marinus]|uniref:DUF4362 domain-containing protein n=1 Tax=Pontibacillus marinus BH030004 = DSM 16465 TaxID=1385511 RepID=A0A0A5I273_9BACI|nr:hypothetical protein [Pontibacillus marinus]KGX89942.1 hypothetical protein N783_03330 [Pontibacillus marinus BH030004 = DSM 16465]